MRKYIAALLTTGLMAFTSSVSADNKDYTVAEAEQEIMKSCIENKKNSKAQCVCVLGGLKAELPQKDYKFMMNIITMVMNGDLSDIWYFAWKNDVSIRQLEALGKSLDEVSKKLDKKCDDPDVNLDLNI